MQLQRPARPDLKARGMGLEGYSLYHAQPGPCQPAVALNDVGRTAIHCRFAIRTGEGLRIWDVGILKSLKSLKSSREAFGGLRRLLLEQQCSYFTGNTWYFTT